MGDVVNFSRKERTLANSIVASSKDHKQFQRAQALLWLDDGESVDEVASRLSVSRQTIYNWILRVHAESEQSLAHRLADAPRSGRPPTARGIIDPLLDRIIEPIRASLATAPPCGLRPYWWRIWLIISRLRSRCAASATHWSDSTYGGSFPGMTWPGLPPRGGKQKGAQTWAVDAPAHGDPHVG
jgi:hypothetical protein